MSYLYDELPYYSKEYKEEIFDVINEKFELFNKYNLPFSINKPNLSNEELFFCIKCANELPEFFRHVMLYASAACHECRKHTPNAWCDDCSLLEILQHMDYLESVFGLKTGEFTHNLTNEEYEKLIHGETEKSEMEDF